MRQAHRLLSSSRVLTDAWVDRNVRESKIQVFLCADKPLIIKKEKKEKKWLCSWIIPTMGVEITAWSVRMCMFIVSKEGTLQLKPFRGALRAWIGPETLFFIREFAADNRSWLPTAEQQFCSLRKWAGESDQGWRWGGKRKQKKETARAIHLNSENQCAWVCVCVCTCM